MIEIDDSGTGDIIGPAFVLFWRRETNDLLRKEIPLQFYQTPEYQQTTKEHIRKLAIEAIEELHIPPTEEIRLCTGACFDLVREYFKEKGYNYQNAKIEGYLQEAAEKTYVDYLIHEYGVPANKISIESGKKRFYDLYSWIIKDFPRRKQYAKTGFEKWNSKWAIDAEREWMMRMVSIDQEKATLIEELPDETSETQKKRPERRPRSVSIHRTPPGKKIVKKTTRSPRSPPFRGRKKTTGKRTENRRPPNAEPPQRRYSSTDPDPRRKLY